MVVPPSRNNLETGAEDMGPLAWVLDETRKSIEAAIKALKRYANEIQTARGVSLELVDANPLRMARQQLHQAQGALEMVGQTIAARMVGGMEGVVQRFVAKPQEIDQKAVTAQETAGFALIEYLTSQLSGQPRPALGLFAQYRQVQQLAGADRIHPADLWNWPWRWAAPQLPQTAQQLGYAPQVRQRLDRGILRILRQDDAGIAADLDAASLDLAAGENARHRAHPAAFWLLAAGLFEALGARLVPFDLYAKRAVSRVLLQYITLAEGDGLVSERLAQDLLFFCAQARLSDRAASLPALAAVRAAWGLDSYAPVDYSRPMFGLYDPAVLAQARRRIDAIKENWSALAGGDMVRLKACSEQLDLVTQSLAQLLPREQPLADELKTVMAQIARANRPPRPELAMETATAVLFLEASFADFHPADALVGERMRQLAQRLKPVREGAPALALEPWMEALYRQVSDRQTMGTVVGELRVTMGEVEGRLDQFFRQPADKGPLTQVPDLLHQMRGVLSVLGLDQAVRAVTHMREQVEGLMAAGGGQTAQASGVFEQLGNNLGSLGFMVDMLGYQPALARQLFVFDDQSGQLKALMGRARPQTPALAPTAAHANAGNSSATGQPAAPMPMRLPAAPAASVDDASKMGLDFDSGAPGVPTAPEVAPVAPVVSPPEADKFGLDFDSSEPGVLAATEPSGQLGTLTGSVISAVPTLAVSARQDSAATHQPDGADLAAAWQTIDMRRGTAPAPLLTEPEATADAVPAQASPVTDDDLLGIFLDEAREVIADGQSAIEALAVMPDDVEQKTILRRTFHTLKGSSRMVGLAQFGEAAWALEQVLNTWLAEQKPAHAQLRGLSAQALDALSRWADDIAAQNVAHWSAVPFRQAADALRLRGQYTPLDLDGVAEPEQPLAAMPAPAAFDIELEPGTQVKPPRARPDVAQSAASQLAPVAAFDVNLLPNLSLDTVASLPSESAAARQAGQPAKTDAEQGFDFDWRGEQYEPTVPMPLELAAAPEVEQRAVNLLPNLSLDTAASLPSEFVAARQTGQPAKPDAEQGFDFDWRGEQYEPTVPMPIPIEFAAAPEVQQRAVNLLPNLSLDTAASLPSESVAARQAGQPAQPDAEQGFDFDWSGEQYEPTVPMPMSLEPAGVSSTEPLEQAIDTSKVLNFDWGDDQDQAEAGDTGTVPGLDAAPVVLVSDVEALEIDFTAFEQARQALKTQSEAVPQALPSSGERELPDVETLELDVTAFDQARQALQARSEASPRAIPSFGHQELTRTEASGAVAGIARHAEDQAVTQAQAPQTKTPALAFSLPTPQPVERPGPPVQPVRLTETASTASAGPVQAQEVTPAPPPAAPASDRQIGDLRLSAELYKVYLEEAQDWSRELSSELNLWGQALNQSVPEQAIVRAHSLAGSSATVGFTALSNLARAVEHALIRLRVQAGGRPGQLRALDDAAAEIGEALRQFADGSLHQPSQAALAAVNAIEAVTQAVPAKAASTPVITSMRVQTAGQQTAVAAPDPAPAEVAPVSAPAQLPAPAAITVKDAPQHAVADNIEVADAVDPDLFPVFEEEARELLPQLLGSLREWIANPGNDEARKQVKRFLHTLKGSARLAGALRMGELAHRAESTIEMIGTEQISSADLEPVQDHVDEIVAALGRLRTDRQPVAPASGVAPLVPAVAQPVMTAPAPLAVAALPASLAVSVPAPASVSAPTPQTAVPATEPVEPLVAQTSQSLSAQHGAIAPPAPLLQQQAHNAASQVVRIKTQLLDRLVNQAGEVMTARSRLQTGVGQLRSALTDLSGNLGRLRTQLRDVELQAEMQMQSRMAQTQEARHDFDPLEFDRYTRMQELTRMMAESVNDVATVQRTLQRAVESGEDDLAAQARQTRELQDGLLRTRMVEFESLAERLYRVVRQAAKEEGKQVRLDIVGGAIEVDRGILERMTGSFEHLLRNCVVHGIETAPLRAERHKDATGVITIEVQQVGNDVSIEFSDDGAGLDLQRIRQKAEQKGLVQPEQVLSDDRIANLVFVSGLSTASQVTGLAGRGVGMDVVRSGAQALGGHIETHTQAGRGSAFKLVLPLTTAVTQVVMLRMGEVTVGVPSNLVEIVRRASSAELQQAYDSGDYAYGESTLPFFWGGALLQSSPRSLEPVVRAAPVIVCHSAAQRVALHVDEVLGNQEVVVKALGPQLSRLPGLVAITALASGEVSLIYNPVALATVYGDQARALTASAKQPAGQGAAVVSVAAPQPQAPLILVVDDSITVRRVVQRLLQREGYRVALAADGLQGLEQLRQERPAVVLSDIEMPRMDGFDFVRNIRADAQWRDLPVIMITSRIAEKHRERARELGVDHYLGKPYSEEQLLTLIRGYAQAAA